MPHDGGEAKGRDMNTLDCINSQCGASAGDCGCAAKVREAAAFLDALADRLEGHGNANRHTAATDCRAMASKLRGET